MGTTEDKALQNDIMDIYQENIPALLASTNAYVNLKSRLLDYLQKNHKRTKDGGSNIAEVLNTEEAHNIIGMLTVTQEITARYDAAIQKMQKVIKAINKQYNLQN